MADHRPVDRFGPRGLYFLSLARNFRRTDRDLVGAIAGNIIGLHLTDWVNWLAGFGAILLTFLAGVEIDYVVIKRNFWSTMCIGLMGFFAPYLGILFFAHFVYGWSWPEAQIAGIALSTTSVAVVYAVMVETGFNRTEIGKIILGACFVNDLGTVLALGLVFANYNWWLLLFAVVTVVVLAILPCLVPWLFETIGTRVSEPEIKGCVRSRSRSMTPFYFLKAGSLVEAKVVIGAAGMIAAYLGMKMLTKFVGILPLTKAFRFKRGRRRRRKLTLPWERSQVILFPERTYGFR